MKDEFLKRKQKFEEETKEREKNVVEDEKKLKREKEAIEKLRTENEKMQNSLKRTEEEMTEKIRVAEQKSSDAAKAIAEYNETLAQAKEKLQRISGLTEEDAKKLLFENLINEVKLEAAQKIQEVRRRPSSNATGSQRT